MTALNVLMMGSSSKFGLLYHRTRLSIGLRKRGHEVTVFSNPREQAEGLFDELIKAGIKCFKSCHIDRLTIYDIHKSGKEIREILKSNQIDVIHAHGVTQTLDSYSALRSRRPDGRPSLVTSVHYIPQEGFLQKPKWVAIATVLNICSDLILPVSDDTKEQLIRHGVNSQKTITVHNGIDLDFFDASAQTPHVNLEITESDKPSVFYVANLIPRKGQEYYLMAAADVLKNRPAVFYVVGSGPRRGYLEELACQLGIEEDVVFTGRIPWPEMYCLLSNVADICVSASLGELFPFYVLECMAAGKPIVATNVGGVSEAVVNGENGYLVSPKDSHSLAKAILRLIEDPEKAKEMGQKGRRLVEQRFSMEVICQELEAIYESTSEQKAMSRD